MLVLFSPTKTQKEAPSDQPAKRFFPEITERILSEMQAYDVDDLKRIYRVSDKIAQAAHHNFATFQEHHIAIQSYQGSTFKNMNTNEWSQVDHDYANKHLLILSALYGLVSPNSRIGLYRLDFLTKTTLRLYDLWQVPVTQALNAMTQPILNLASKEYVEMIDTNNLTVPFVSIDFRETVGSEVVVKATYAKIARGKMASQVIKQRITNFEDLKKISFDDYVYNESLSNQSLYVFTR
ncbi:YaaA family protein [Erysipelothrix sp. HDW6C]|uniref:YaaA family protein n=1 Tax=Erysipelothrix sp. HDW6C TaxID=2714930 RepID=UPI00140B8A46|nr:YaaA family protein [Erysipelothrix sp. HDW6C]QIK68907.1 YaaA family protein [Erysipelothrix sp. HDW6C]